MLGKLWTKFKDWINHRPYRYRDIGPHHYEYEDWTGW